MCLVAKPLNRNEAKGDLVMIETLLFFKCKLLCYHANQILVSLTTRAPSASLQIKGLATKYTTVKWPIVMHNEESWFLELLDSAYFAAGSEIISLLSICKTVFLLWCQSVSGGNFGGLEPLCVQRNGLLEHDSAVTSSFGNVLDSSFNNRTGFLVDDPLFSAVDWKLKENEVNQRDKYFAIL